MSNIYKGINFCFLSGRIISNIDFKFFYNSKIHNSIARFEIEINYKNSTRKLKKQIIQIKAYDDNADIVYSTYSKGKNINIIGKVTSKDVEIDEIV